MIVECKNCGTKYKIIDSKIPAKGAILTCKKCGNKIKILPPKDLLMKETSKTTNASTVDNEEHEKAKRYARVLASDAYLYNERKVNNARAMGTLFEDMRDEVIKSYGLYKNRIKNPDILKENYFFDAFNKQLAGGETVFTREKLGI